MLPLQRHKPFYVPPEEITHRIGQFQSALKGLDVSLGWIEHNTDLLYYSGSLQNGILLIPAEGLPRYFVKRSIQKAEAESPLNVLPYPGRKSILKTIREMVNTDKRLGMALDIIPASTVLWLKEKLDGFRAVDIGPAILLQKAVKREWEISQIEKAAEQAKTIFQDMDQFLRPNMTELELSASIEHRLRLLGHSGTIRVRNPDADLGVLSAVSGDAALFPTCFDGPVGGEGLYPSTVPQAGWKKIVTGETVMVDMVTSYNGYQADDARTFYLGREIPDQGKRAHDFCLEVLDKLEMNIRPGRTCSEVYHEVNQWIDKQILPEGFMGYGENRVKFFGHGIGLELDELPVIAGKIDLELRPNMIVALEPKAFLPGLGPVGVENTYQITDDGCKNLCEFSEEIILLEGY